MVANDNAYPVLKDCLSGTNIGVASGSAALLEAAALPADFIMASIMGKAGLAPLMKAIAQGTVVAVAIRSPWWRRGL